MARAKAKKAATGVAFLNMRYEEKEPTPDNQDNQLRRMTK